MYIQIQNNNFCLQQICSIICSKQFACLVFQNRTEFPILLSTAANIAFVVFKGSFRYTLVDKNSIIWYLLSINDHGIFHFSVKKVFLCISYFWPVFIKHASIYYIIQLLNSKKYGFLKWLQYAVDTQNSENRFYDIS